MYEGRCPICGKKHRGALATTPACARRHAAYIRSLDRALAQAIRKTKKPAA